MKTSIIKKIGYIAVSAFTILACSNITDDNQTSENPNLEVETPVYGEFTDKRNNKTYQTTDIDGTIWMAENLDVSTFRNGDAILEIKPMFDKDRMMNTKWQNALNYDNIPACCYIYTEEGNNLSKVNVITRYGKIYNKYAVSDSRGLAPEGWHIATEEEWKNLEKKYKENTLFAIQKKGEWIKQDNYTEEAQAMINMSGFSALAGGKRTDSGVCHDGAMAWASWWYDKANLSVLGHAILTPSDESFKLYSLDGDWIRGTINHSSYVRCVKDK